MHYTYAFVISFMIALSSVTAASSAAAQQRGDKAGRNYSTLKQLPRNHFRGVNRGNPYFYTGGRFYRNRGGLYVGITAPIGAIVPALPGGFITIGTGSRRFFYHNNVYYQPAPQGYVVVEKPNEPKPTSLPVVADTGRIIVYPNAGQSEEQRGRDRYECHLWAEDETGFDPSMSNADESLRNDYVRAMSACLEARDYVVR